MAGRDPGDTSEAGAAACPVCASRLPPDASIRGVDRLLGVPGTFELRRCEVCGAGCTFPPVPDERLGELYPQGYGSHEGTAGGPFAGLLATMKRAQIAALLRRAPFSLALDGGPG